MTAIRKHVVVSDEHKLHLDLDVPKDIPAGEIVITLYMEPVRKPNPRKAAACLREIAERGNLQLGPDPAQWQREIRRDRPLPGRE